MEGNRGQRDGKVAAKREQCPHCDELLTVPVFKKHKGLFYDPNNRKWNRKTKPSGPGMEELDYEDDMIISGFNVW